MKSNFYSNLKISYSVLNNALRVKKVGWATKIGFFFLIAVTFVVVSAFTFSPVNEQEVTIHLKRFLEEERVIDYFENHAQKEILSTALNQAYSTNNFEPLWLEGGNSLIKLDSLIIALKDADKEGLQPATYHLDQIESLRKKANIDAASLAELDHLATASFLLYASHLYNGSITPSQLDSTWHIQPKAFPFATYLQKTLQAGNIKQALIELSTANPSYNFLKKELASLKAISEKGGWATIATKRILTKNDSGEVVYNLKQRLTLSGDLDSTSSNGKIFDQALVQAVQKFQQRHGLPITGKVDTKTLTALNIPVEKRIEQVILNLERMRWLPNQKSATIITVNIPEFKLRVWEQKKQVMEANVVVGKMGHTTPIFEDSLETIVFSPEWNVPNQIAVNEILPKLQEDPNYLRKNNFEVYKSYKANAKPVNPYSVNWKTVSPENFIYRFVQKANKKNSLGAVKFLFPNPLNIYIHDTPAKQLFKENQRAFSHGCIRLENPAKLAARLLKNEANWTEAKIQGKMHLTESTEVELSKKVKVEITYLTAFVQNGKLNFRDDVYGYDQPQLDILRN